MPETAVGLMAKFPEPGKVKTRLAADIGDAGALRVYTLLLQATIEKIRQLDINHFHTAVFVAQSGLVGEFQNQFHGLTDYQGQVNGDLGQRMEAAYEQLLGIEGIRRAILVGADIPDLSAELISQAANALSQNDVVLGPTHDGGYYLIGLHQVHSVLFTEIEWSGATVLDTSVKRAQEAGLRTKLLARLSDLDTVDDLERIQPTNRLIIDTLNSYLPTNTSRYREHKDG